MQQVHIRYGTEIPQSDTAGKRRSALLGRALKVVVVRTDHKFVGGIAQAERLAVAGIKRKGFLPDVGTEAGYRRTAVFRPFAACKSVVGIGIAVGIAHADFAVAAVAEVMFQIGEHVVAVHFKFVPIRADKGVFGQLHQRAVMVDRQAVVRRKVALLVEIAYAQSRVGIDVPIRRRIEGFVVVVFLGGTRRRADGLRHHAAAHAAVGVQTA